MQTFQTETPLHKTEVKSLLVITLYCKHSDLHAVAERICGGGGGGGGGGGQGGREGLSIS